MGSAERRMIVEGLATLAVTFAEMGNSDAEALSQLHGQFDLMGEADASIVDEAAAEVALLPAPFEENMADVEPRRATNDAPASIQAREWLQFLAAQLRG